MRCATTSPQGPALPTSRGAPSPCVGKRSLSETELREVWLATDAVDDGGKRLVAEDYARIIKLLILTGQRKGEVGGLDWVEIVEGGGHGDRIEMPETRTKNHLPHMVPLSAQAMALLPPRPDRHDPMARTMVFGRRAHTGFSGWSKAKAELDAAILAARRNVNPKATPMEPWVVHDLRRTTATLLRELNLADTHLVELILNHVSGTRAGVAGVYDKSERMADRRKALEAWGRSVTLFGGPGRPIHSSTLYRGIANGLYPRPVWIGANSVRWLRSEYLAARQRTP